MSYNMQHIIMRLTHTPVIDGGEIYENWSWSDILSATALYAH